MLFFSVKFKVIVSVFESFSGGRGVPCDTYSMSLIEFQSIDFLENEK